RLAMQHPEQRQVGRIEFLDIALVAAGPEEVGLLGMQLVEIGSRRAGNFDAEKTRHLADRLLPVGDDVLVAEEQRARAFERPPCIDVVAPASIWHRADYRLGQTDLLSAEILDVVTIGHDAGTTIA